MSNTKMDEEIIKDDLALVEELEGQRNIKEGTWQYWMVAIIAFSWSLYQIYVVIVPTNSVFIRSFHLAFALALAFAMYPMFRTPKTMTSIPWYNFPIAIASVIGALYIFINYDALNARSGAWSPLDVAMGIGSIFLLLKAARRALGMALPIIALIFIAYDYFGQYMPDLIAHKGASINKIVGQMYLTTEGIFGVPLGVSASYVFLFVLFGALLERAGA
ncbi:MAG: TRAP transporter permease, partial [Sulfurovaceae bacterium]|nr:TRAP transporter permease [Sulfurovaceae bacterium]